ncbi:trimethyltridecatetraene synthase-like isoform X1 [Solanum dulcamara]|uniref:trimethyltridecatetraene synthase-like isoform X1 n=1 Tax=Solanum dulcamara TaxID=45834 RepID=UPI00248621E8|nr:trimethyltridecatetraene synthase-like isoform X1 [Solanum dulcamara]
MEIFWIFIASGAWLLALAFLSKIFNHPKRKLPPGPRPWPIIGNLNLLGSHPHESLHHLSQKYGDLMLLKFGSKPVLIASSPEMAKEILKTHDAIFASRPLLAAGKYTSFNYSDMTWTPYGAYWRQARKIYLTEILNPRRLDSFEYIRVEERQTLISRLFTHSGKPIFLKDHLPRFTLRIVSRFVMSDKYFSDQSNSDVSKITLEAIQRMLDEWFILSGVINLGDWIPWLSVFDLQGYVKRMKTLGKDFTHFYKYVLEDHKVTKRQIEEDYVPKDIINVLLNLADDPNLVVKLTSDGLMGLIHDLITGTTDTAAATVEWAFQELLRRPYIIDKVHQELDRAIGKERWVEEEDFSQLPYIEAIIKETFRLHPLCALLPPHYSMEDCNVAGYDIPKGTSVYVNAWSLGRNSKYWDRPEEFIPERFIENNIDIKGQNFTLLPFGSGRRRCPGYKLGMKITQIIMANLLHGFNWKLAGDMKPKDISMEEIYALTTHPNKPISVIMEPRLPLHLY